MSPEVITDLEFVGNVVGGEALYDAEPPLTSAESLDVDYFDQPRNELLPVDATCENKLGFTALCASCPLVSMFGGCPKTIRENAPTSDGEFVTITESDGVVFTKGFDDFLLTPLGFFEQDVSGLAGEDDAHVPVLTPPLQQIITPQLESTAIVNEPTVKDVSDTASSNTPTSRPVSRYICQPRDTGVSKAVTASTPPRSQGKKVSKSQSHSSRPAAATLPVQPSAIVSRQLSVPKSASQKLVFTQEHSEKDVVTLHRPSVPFIAEVQPASSPAKQRPEDIAAQQIPLSPALPRAELCVEAKARPEPGAAPEPQGAVGVETARSYRDLLFDDSINIIMAMPRKDALEVSLSSHAVETGQPEPSLVNDSIVDPESLSPHPTTELDVINSTYEHIEAVPEPVDQGGVSSRGPIESSVEPEFEVAAEAATLEIDDAPLLSGEVEEQKKASPTSLSLSAEYIVTCDTIQALPPLRSDTPERISVPKTLVSQVSRKIAWHLLGSIALLRSLQQA